MISSGRAVCQARCFLTLDKSVTYLQTDVTKLILPLLHCIV
jgi:hypothetical protein